MQKSHRHAIFTFFCLISALFVMIMSVFFTTEACLFQVVTICIQWRAASSETWTGQLRMNLAGFDRPKVCKKKILCLYSPTLKVHSTKTSAPLRFSELGKQRATKNAVYLIREACSKIIIFTVCKVWKRSWRTWLVFP